MLYSLEFKNLKRLSYFKFEDHNVFTNEINKIALRAQDDKKNYNELQYHYISYWAIQSKPIP